MSCDQNLLQENHQKSALVAQCPPPTPPSSSESTITVGPLLHTTWNQDCVYNTYCAVLSDGPCGFAYTGCVTTAMAQVMAYWKYPSSYSWASMPNNYGNSAVARLMGDIFNLVITKYNATEGSSDNNTSNNVVAALKNNFNYSSATYGTYQYSYNAVVANLNNKQPVMLGGCQYQASILGIPYKWWSCHEWVCDGYMQSTYYTNGVETSQYLYFDMNWGWGGSYNGWYAFDTWSSGNGYFRYSLDMIYNIHP